MNKVVSKYILELNKAEQLTKRSEDRTVYEKLLAGAAVILAQIDAGAEMDIIVKTVHEHERLRGMSWLADDVHKNSSATWQNIMES